MADKIFALNRKVILKRQRLNEMAASLGVNHPRVMSLNKRLDKLVVELQRLKMAGYVFNKE